MAPSPIELLEKEARFARSLARSLLFDEHLAEDVVQQAWLTILQRPPRDHGRVGAWFGKVCKNLALQTRRGAERRKRRELRSAVPEAQPSVAETIDRERMLRTVTDSVLALDEPYRHTILMRYFDDVPPREIARRDGVPVATVRSRLQRGQQKLREKLEAEYQEDRHALGLGLFALADPRGFERVFPPEGGVPTDGGLSLPRVPVGSVAIVGAGVGLVVLATLTLASFSNDAEPVDARALEDVDSDRAAHGFSPFRAPLTTDESAADDHDAPAGLRADQTALRLACSFRSDDAPAASVRVRVIDWTQEDPLIAARELETDANGVVWITGVAAGPITVFADRGGRLDTRLEPRKWTHAALVIPVGVAIDGVTLDARGKPVGGADVWISGAWPDDPGFVVAQSDARGRFAVRDVEPRRSFGARVDDLEPTSLADVVGPIGRTMPATLIFGPAAGRVAGRVVGPDDRPIEGARVRVRSTRTLFVGTDGNDGAALAPVTCSTGADGRFDVRGLALGENEVVARAAGLGAVGVLVDVDRTTAPLHLRLEPSGALEGRVTYADGAPAGHVVVRNTADALAFTDGDGRFRLTGLAAGHAQFTAGPTGAGAEAGFVITAGAAAVWNPILATPLVVRGMVSDEAGGRPRPGLVVAVDVDSTGGDALPGSFAAAPRARSDADGRFEIDVVPSHRPLRLRVTTDDGGLPLAIVSFADPPAEPIVLRAAALVADGIRGHVFDDSGSGRAARVHVRRADSDGADDVVTTTGTDGRFTLGAVPAGSYHVTVHAPGLAPATVEAAVRGDRPADLGAITLSPLGVLVLEPSSTGATIFVAPTSSLDAAGTTRVELASTPVRLELPPGTYDVRVVERSGVRHSLRAVVSAGSETLVQPGAGSGGGF